MDIDPFSFFTYHKHKYELGKDEWPEWMTDTSDDLQEVHGYVGEDENVFGFETHKEALRHAWENGYDVSVYVDDPAELYN